MARYIDADKLTDKLEEIQFYTPVMTPIMKIYNVIELVEDQPTADVVEVVRCKDCKHCEFDAEHSGDGYEPEAYCNWYESGVGGLDFCSYGERNDA